MALDARTIFESRTDATAGNVNAGGFNPSNANFLTDLACDTNTGNTDSPVVSSASYNFVAGDVNHWVYVKAGTNWTVGWYKIASVAANKATLQAAVGQAVQADSTKGMPSPRYLANTVAGCATVGTPTGGTFTIDYSQGTAAILTNTDITCTAASTTVNSAGGGFTPVMVGNLIHFTALTGTGAIVGWYEIVQYTDGNNVVLDRTPTNGVNNITAGTFYVGGAISLGSSGASRTDDAFFELGKGTNGVGAMRFFIKAGSYSPTAIAMSVAGGTLNPIVVEGYNALRGDTPTGSSRPTFAMGANGFNFGADWDTYNLIVTSTASPAHTIQADGKFVNCKIINKSTSAGRAALQATGADAWIHGVELASYRGYGLGSVTRAHAVGLYIHDCNVGIYNSGSTSWVQVLYGIIEGCVTAAVRFYSTLTSNPYLFANCTFYGAENKLGIGFDITVTGSMNLRVINSTFAGFVTGIQHVDAGQTEFFADFNDFYNNTTDRSNVAIGANDKAVDPSFTSVSQITGTAGAFTAGNDRLVDTSKNFSSLGVVAGQDCVYIVSGTGVTAGIYGIASLATTTNPNDTLVLDIVPGTDTTADKTYQISVGHNYLPTGAI